MVWYAVRGCYDDHVNSFLISMYKFDYKYYTVAVYTLKPSTLWFPVALAVRAASCGGYVFSAFRKWPVQVKRTVLPSRDLGEERVSE